MRAIRSHPSRQLEVQERPDPSTGPDDLLIEVYATALNRADLLQRAGRYDPPPGVTDILGLECAGRVLAWGERVTGWAVGDPVMALLPGGGYAERVAVHHGSVMRIPDGLGWAEAAAIPEAWLTAYSNLIEIGRLRAGERALVHAGASGVGSAAIQLAKWRGAWVAATASAGKVAAVRSIGADLVVDYRAESFHQAVMNATAGKGVDIILDFVGAPYLDDNLRTLASWGRLILVGLMGGRQAEIDLGLLLSRKLTVAGSTLRDRTAEQKARLVAAFSTAVLPAFATGALYPVLDSQRFLLADVERAHERMRNNLNVGKIVLVVRGDEVP